MLKEEVYSKNIDNQISCDKWHQNQSTP